MMKIFERKINDSISFKYINKNSKSGIPYTFRMLLQTVSETFLEFGCVHVKKEAIYLDIFYQPI